MVIDEKKDPTIKDVMDELDRAEQRDRISIWVSVVAVGFGFTAASVIAQQGWNTLIGAILMVIGFLGAYFRVNPDWHYRK
jgi:uncharacterized membrane protein YjjP (DUF1212 family)